MSDSGTALPAAYLAQLSYATITCTLRLQVTVINKSMAQNIELFLTRLMFLFHFL